MKYFHFMLLLFTLLISVNTQGQSEPPLIDSTLILNDVCDDIIDTDVNLVCVTGDCDSYQSREELAVMQSHLTDWIRERKIEVDSLNNARLVQWYADYSHYIQNARSDLMSINTKVTVLIE